MAFPSTESTRLSTGGSKRAPLATSHLGDRAKPKVSIPFFPKKRKSAPPCSYSKRPAGVVCVVTEDRDRVRDLASSMWGDASHAWPGPSFWAPWGHGQGMRSGSGSLGSQSWRRAARCSVFGDRGAAVPSVLGTVWWPRCMSCRSLSPTHPLAQNAPRHRPALLLKTPKSHPRGLSGAEVFPRPPTALHGGRMRGKRCSLAQGSALPSGGWMKFGAGGASAKPPASSLGGGGSFFLLSCCQKGKLLHETRGGAARHRFPKAFRSVSQRRIPRGALASCSLHRGRRHPRVLSSTKAPSQHPLSASAPSDFGLAHPSSWRWRVPRLCPSATGRRGGRKKHPCGFSVPLLPAGDTPVSSGYSCFPCGGPRTHRGRGALGGVMIGERSVAAA